LTAEQVLQSLLKELQNGGIRQFAITDHGVCSGLPRLWLQATKAGIKIIYGMEPIMLMN
jgi:DNA polymerase III alpha subunit (gram-positive type)